MTIQIIPAEPEDGVAISVIMTDWIEQTEWMPRIHSDVENKNFGNWLIEVSDVVVAVEEGFVVGFLAQQGCEIQALYVREAFRGTGIGADLLRHSKSSASNIGLWTFQKNFRAQAFYCRNGFVEDKRTDGQGNDEKLPDIYFIWTKENQ